jgi:hypothetical protein
MLCGKCIVTCISTTVPPGNDVFPYHNSKAREVKKRWVDSIVCSRCDDGERREEKRQSKCGKERSLGEGTYRWSWRETLWVCKRGSGGGGGGGGGKVWSEGGERMKWAEYENRKKERKEKSLWRGGGQELSYILGRLAFFCSFYPLSLPHSNCTVPSANPLNQTLWHVHFRWCEISFRNI